MEVIIDLIVWLMRALFGEPEKPADPTKFPSNQPKRGVRRGPYVYGDEPAAQQGKTLEQILEEVRREALERRQGGAPRPAPEASVEPESERRRTLVEELEHKDAQAASQAPRPGHMLDVDALPSERKTVARKQLEVAPPPPTSIPKREAPAPIAVTKTVQTIGTIKPAADELVDREAEAPRRKKRRRGAEVAPVPGPPVGSSLHLLHAIRSAPPGEKARFAREALVIFEVFSAPRARRPHRTGARII